MSYSLCFQSVLCHSSFHSSHSLPVDPHSSSCFLSLEHKEGTEKQVGKERYTFHSRQAAHLSPKELASWRTYSLDHRLSEVFPWRESIKGIPSLSWKRGSVVLPICGRISFWFEEKSWWVWLLSILQHQEGEVNMTRDTMQEPVGGLLVDSQDETVDASQPMEWLPTRIDPPVIGSQGLRSMVPKARSRWYSRLYSIHLSSFACRSASLSVSGLAQSTRKEGWGKLFDWPLV